MTTSNINIHNKNTTLIHLILREKYHTENVVINQQLIKVKLKSQNVLDAYIIFHNGSSFLSACAMNFPRYSSSASL